MDPSGGSLDRSAVGRTEKENDTGPQPRGSTGEQ